MRTHNRVLLHSHLLMLTCACCRAGLTVLGDEQGMQVVGKLVAAQAVLFAKTSMDPLAREAAREAAKEAVTGSYVSSCPSSSLPAMSLVACSSCSTALAAGCHRAEDGGAGERPPQRAACAEPRAGRWRSHVPGPAAAVHVALCPLRPGPNLLRAV